MRRKLPVLLALFCALGLLPGHAAGAIGLANHRLLPEPAPQAPSQGDRHGSSAPGATCSSRGNEGASVAVQLAAMRCLVDRARRHAGLDPLTSSNELDRSARDKSADILRCKSFSHFACGREFTFWMKRVGYLSASCWRAAENLAWGVGTRGSPRAIFRTWMHSPEHRANILGHYSQIGIGLRVGNLNGNPGSHVWTAHFGTHC